MQKELFGFALGALVVVASLGAGMAIRNDGLEFPDGSVQSTALLLPAATAVQGEGRADIAEFQFCSSDTLYTVPTGKRLAIEWVSVLSAAITLADPVDVIITTRSGTSPITHQLVRLTGSVQVDGSFFFTQLWNSPVRLYSDGGQNVEIKACRDVDAAQDHLVKVTFSGHLVDVT